MASRKEMLVQQKEETQPEKNLDSNLEFYMSKDELLRQAQKRRQMRKKNLYSNEKSNLRRAISVDNKLLECSLKTEMDYLTRLEHRVKRRNEQFINSFVSRKVIQDSKVDHFVSQIQSNELPQLASYLEKEYPLFYYGRCQHKPQLIMPSAKGYQFSFGRERKFEKENDNKSKVLNCENRRRSSMFDF
ncbi:uncharacterized protein LOC142346885 [Convolutriloba macropyga]|uniref:uncharacterized protein LOC142346885 n=1 Tax=Convolutriloba macropyga TaxID=536237 RepID=UPI003F51B077